MDDGSRTSISVGMRRIQGPKTVKKKINSTQNKSQIQSAGAYEVASLLSTDCELSTDTCSKNIYSIGPRSVFVGGVQNQV